MLISESYYYDQNPECPTVRISLAEIYRQQAERDNGKGVTWWRPAYRMTYKEIYEEGIRLAKGLIALGLKPGDCVTSMEGETPDCLLMFVATTSIGLMHSVGYIDGNYPKSQVNRILDEMEPKVIIMGNAPAFGPDDKMIYAPAYVCPELESRLRTNPDYQAPFLFYDRVAETDPRCEWSSAEEGGLVINSLDRLRRMGEEVTDEELNRWIAEVPYNFPCAYFDSSGSTTGESKMCIIGSSMFANLGMRKEKYFGLTEEVIHAFPNLSTDDIALFDEFCAGCYTGREVVALPWVTTKDIKEASEEMLRCLAATRAQVVFADNTHFGYVMAHVDDVLERYDLSQLKAWMFACVGMSPTFKETVLQYFPDSFDAYGLSENYWATVPLIGRQTVRLTSIGKAMPNDEAKIVDADGVVVDRNTPGQLLIRSDSNFLGYKNDPEQTRKALTWDNWLKTGDCAIMDDEGYISIIGRMSVTERYNVRGFNIYARNVENTMATHPAIKDIVVVGVATGTPRGDELCYCVIPKRGEQLTADDMYTYAKTKLSELDSFYGTPTRVFFYEEFPLQGRRRKPSRRALMQECRVKIAEDRYAALCDEQSYKDLYG